MATTEKICDDALLEPWVELAGRLGFSRSVGQIYGLLFLSEAPLSAQDCVAQLGISRSSAGQGLKSLREVGAIRTVFMTGDRSERFAIEPDLGVMVGKILDLRLMPAFAAFFVSLEQAARTADCAVSPQRVQKLGRWRDKLVDAVSTVKQELL